MSQQKNLKNFPAFALGVTGQGIHGSLNSLNFSVELENTNWISGVPPISYNLKPRTYSSQIRYHGEFLPCRIKIARQDLATAEIIFKKPMLVASGQSVVIYDKDVCVGGGVVK